MIGLLKLHHEVLNKMYLENHTLKEKQVSLIGNDIGIFSNQSIILIRQLKCIIVIQYTP